MIEEDRTTPLWMDREAAEDDLTIPRAVCILITRMSDDGGIEVLAVSRRYDPSAFGLPGGKVESGEARIAAARRELWEETGLDATVFEPVFSCVCRGDVDYETTTFRVMHHYGVAGTRMGEGVVRWVSPDVLVVGPFGDYNRRLFTEVGIPFTG